MLPIQLRDDLKKMSKNGLPRKAKRIDIDRYLGKWYEIGKKPFFFERNCKLTTAEYSREKDFIRVVNTCKRFDGRIKQARGTAKFTDTPNILRVKFSVFSPRGNYIIEFVDENYQVALVGSSSKNLLWVLSRKATMKKEILDFLLGIAKRKGYDLSDFKIERKIIG